MTRQYSDSIALAARRIVAASAVDITEPVSILPLARQLMQETGCGIDAAKRHVAQAVRLARGELTTSPAWGGRRTPAGGRPKMKYRNIHTGQIETVENTEIVNNPPIRVFILSDGSRWNKEQFTANWQEVKRDFAKEYEDRESTEQDA